MYDLNVIVLTSQPPGTQTATQLKHLFGGIEAEKNPSLEQLEASQKKIAKAMERAQASHMKIYQAVVTIKTSLNELNENYLALAKEKGGGLLGRLTQEMSGLLQDVGEESLSLAKKMESKVENYIPNLKKIKEKYTECAETLEHYRRKLSLLQKNVDRQSLANIKQDEHERYERVTIFPFRIKKNCVMPRKSMINSLLRPQSALLSSIVKG